MYHLLKFVSLVLAVQTFAAHSLAEEKKDENIELQGVWVVQSSLKEGKQFDDPVGGTVNFDGNKFNMKPKTGEALTGTTFSLSKYCVRTAELPLGHCSAT